MKFKRHIICVVLAVLGSVMNLSAQDTVVVNSIPKEKKSFFPRVLNGVTKFFMGCDTNYVTPQKYQFTTQLELSYWNDFYRLRSSETGNTMNLESVVSPRSSSAGFPPRMIRSLPEFSDHEGL